MFMNESTLLYFFLYKKKIAVRGYMGDLAIKGVDRQLDK